MEEDRKKRKFDEILDMAGKIGEKMSVLEETVTSLEETVTSLKRELNITKARAINMVNLLNRTTATVPY